jgi:uncharacterized protein (DUF2249 family)
VNTITDHLIDVRTIVPRERHPLIFQTWESLPPGEAILLVNDHDPLPLFYQFAAECAGGFRWDYQDQGPEVWRVRITKGEFADPGFKPSGKPKHSCTTRAVPIEFTQPHVLDTRPIFAAGETPCTAIDEAVSCLIPGQPLVLLVPFEPVPLYTKLGKQGFTHKSEQQSDGGWRVEFRKTN